MIGCGGIGLAAINAAKIAGAARIIAIDPVPAKRELAEKLGATDSFDPGAERLREQVVELTRGGVHHAIEAVGRIAAGELALSLLRRGGTATIVGMMPLEREAADARARPARREEAAGLPDGLEPLPGRHPAAGRFLPAPGGSTSTA